VDSSNQHTGFIWKSKLFCIPHMRSAEWFRFSTGGRAQFWPQSFQYLGACNRTLHSF